MLPMRSYEFVLGGHVQALAHCRPRQQLVVPLLDRGELGEVQICVRAQHRDQPPPSTINGEAVEHPRRSTAHRHASLHVGARTAVTNDLAGSHPGEVRQVCQCHPTQRQPPLALRVFQPVLEHCKDADCSQSMTQMQCVVQGSIWWANQAPRHFTWIAHRRTRVQTLCFVQVALLCVLRPALLWCELQRRHSQSTLCCAFARVTTYISDAPEMHHAHAAR